jgi:formate dehydrogenase beta subunit
MKRYKVDRKDFIIPRCSSACPAGVDVPRYIRAVREGRYDDAVAVLREKLPLPTVCADACFAPCEDVCACKQFGEPVAIRALKRSAVDNGGDAWLQNKRHSASTGKTVAVIGAGPAGLTASYYLATQGHAVTIFDAWPEPGGTLRYGVPEFRLPKERLKRDIKYILDLGVDFKGNNVVGQNITFDELRQDYDSIFIACGTMANADLDLKGGVEEEVIWGWDFLKEVAQGKEFDLGSKVVVIGGGNVALDAARTARRLGASKVTLIYRRSKSEMPAIQEEVIEAEKEGIEILSNWAPDQILCEEGVTALGLVKCVSENDGGRECRLVYDEDITHCVNADTIIKAIGQEPDLSFLSGGLAVLSSPTELKVRPDTLQTAIEGVFAGGDVVTGPTSIVSAIGQGRKAAEAIDVYLGGTGDVSEKLAQPEDVVEIVQLNAESSIRQNMATVKPLKRITGFEQVEMGLSRQQITSEADRCLDCDARKFLVTLNTEKCKDCGYCVEVCGVDTFGQADDFNTKGYRPMESKSSDWCVGCFKCYFACPDFAIDVKEANA